MPEEELERLRQRFREEQREIREEEREPQPWEKGFAAIPKKEKKEPEWPGVTPTDVAWRDIRLRLPHTKPQFVGRFPEVQYFTPSMPDEFNAFLDDELALLMDNMATNAIVSPPEPWNYEIANATDMRGMDGEALPANAIAWDKYGRPFYGEGLPGLWKRITSNFARPVEEDKGPLLLTAKEVPGVVALQMEAVRKHQEGDLGGAMKDTGKAFLGWGVAQLTRFWRGLEDTPAVGPLARKVGGGVTGFFELQNEATLAFERREGPEMLAQAEIIRRAAEQDPNNAMWSEAFANSIFQPYADVRANLSELAIKKGYATEEDYQDLVARNKDAGRVAYSALRDPLILAEWERRMAEGADPRLLALELEDTGAEFWGRLANDPTIIIGFITGRVKALRMLAGNKNTYARPASNAIQQASLRAAAAQTDNVAAQAADELVTAVRTTTREVRDGWVQRAGRRGLFSPLARSKVVHQAERVGIFQLAMIQHTKGDPDSFLNIMRGLAHIAGDEPDEILQGMYFLNEAGITREMAFSPAGLETGVVMRNLAIDDAGNWTAKKIKNAIEKSGDDVADLTDRLAKINTDVLEDIYPTIDQQIKYNEKYTKLLAEDADEAARYLELHPLADQPISKSRNIFNNAHKAAQRFFYRPAANAQGILYMGTSPGYFTRARYGNVMPMFVDLGPEPAAKMLANRVGPIGFSPLKAIDEITKYLGGVLPESAKRGISAIGSAVDEIGDGILHAFSRLAQADEQAGSAYVVATSVRRNMKKIMPKAANVAELTLLPDQLKARLRTLVDLNYGDVGEAVKLLRAEEGLPLARSLAWANTDQLHLLREHGIFDDVLRAVREGETLDDVLRNMDDIGRGYSAGGNLASRETPFFDILEEHSESLVRAAQAIEQVLGPDAADAFMASVQSNRVAAAAFKGLYDDIEALARNRLNIHFGEVAERMGRNWRQGIDDAQNAIDETIQAFDVDLDEYTDGVFTEADEFTAKTWADNDWAARKTPEERALRWRETGIPGEPPEGLTTRQFRDALWDTHYRPVQRERFSGLREYTASEYRKRVTKLSDLAGIPDDEIIRRARKAEAELARARMFDDVVIKRGQKFADVPASNLEEALIARYDELIQRAPGGGSGESLRRAIASARERGLSGEDLYNMDVTVREAIDAVVGGDVDEAATRARHIRALGILLEEVTEEGIEPTFRVELVPAADDFFPSLARVNNETQAGVRNLLNEMKAGVEANWNRLETAEMTPAMEQQLREWTKTSTARMTEARTIAMAYAGETRDFILHHYQKRRGLDLMLSYVYPYHFWYTRSYAKWMQRIALSPFIGSTYAGYRDWLEKQHAGLPEWFKYQINTDELLGIETDNPLFFNLESFLNPLNGVTGIDFNDPRRRVDNWSMTVDNLNKFGPSVWTPFQVALALVYHANGQDEAASRWTGRLWGPTRTFRDITALMGFEEGKGIEVDPFIHFFSGGIGPWDRGRAGRMFYPMGKEGVYSQAELMDAAYEQEGPIWDKAVAESIHQRAPNLWQILAPWFLGAGFRPRTQHDVQIDRIYARIHGLYTMKPLMAEDEYQEAWDELRREFPPFEAMLLSRKGGYERDEALAWGVLNRIPPGQKNQFAELVGMKGEDLDWFYKNKGDLVQMNKAQRMRFMAGVLEIAALLDVPDQATRAEWDAAKKQYRGMTDVREQVFGEGIGLEIDTYFAKYAVDPDLGKDYLIGNPQVEEALDWTTQAVLTSPLLAAYYTSIERIEKYLKGQLYEEAESRWGADLWDRFEVWSNLKATNTKDAKKYWKDNPQMEKYVDLKEGELPKIAEMLNIIGGILPEGKPARFREGEPLPEFISDREAWIQAQTLEYMSEEPEELVEVPQLFPSINALLQIPGGDKLYRLVIDYLAGEDLPASALQQLDAIGFPLEILH